MTSSSYGLPRCARCGQVFERLTADQRYDQRCQRDVDAIEAREAQQPAWLPTWRRDPIGKDLTPGRAR